MRRSSMRGTRSTGSGHVLSRCASSLKASQLRNGFTGKHTDFPLLSMYRCQTPLPINHFSHPGSPAEWMCTTPTAVSLGIPCVLFAHPSRAVLQPTPRASSHIQVVPQVLLHPFYADAPADLGPLMVTKHETFHENYMDSRNSQAQTTKPPLPVKIEGSGTTDPSTKRASPALLQQMQRDHTPHSFSLGAVKNGQNSRNFMTSKQC